MSQIHDEALRQELWKKIHKLMGKLPEETAHHVCAWFAIYCGMHVTKDELNVVGPPAKMPTWVLQQLAQDLKCHQLMVFPNS